MPHPHTNDDIKLMYTVHVRRTFNMHFIQKEIEDNSISYICSRNNVWEDGFWSMSKLYIQPNLSF